MSILCRESNLSTFIYTLRLLNLLFQPAMEAVAPQSAACPLMNSANSSSTRLRNCSATDEPSLSSSTLKQ